MFAADGSCGCTSTSSQLFERVGRHPRAIQQQHIVGDGRDRRLQVQAAVDVDDRHRVAEVLDDPAELLEPIRRWSAPSRRRTSCARRPARRRRPSCRAARSAPAASGASTTPRRRPSRCRRDAAPGRVITAISSSTTAVSSMNTASGMSAVEASRWTCSRAPPARARTPHAAWPRARRQSARATDASARSRPSPGSRTGQSNQFRHGDASHHKHCVVRDERRTVRIVRTAAQPLRRLLALARARPDFMTTRQGTSGRRSTRTAPRQDRGGIRTRRHTVRFPFRVELVHPARAT